MHDIGAAGGLLAQSAHKIGHGAVFGLAVDTDAVLDGNGNLHRILHGVEAVGHQRRVVHQAGAECAFLHARAGAAAIEVDFVIAVIFGRFGRFGQIGRLAAAQLQGERIFAFVKH